MGSSRNAAHRWVVLLAGSVVLLTSLAGPVHAQPAAAQPEAEAVAAAVGADPAPAAQAPAAEAPAPGAPAAEAPAVPEEPPPEIDALEAAEAAAEQQSADLSGFRERELRARLETAKREEQDTSLLWPWVTTLVGWGSMLAGVAIGTGHVLACEEDSCTGPYWPTWMVIGGSLVGSLGTLWVVLEERDLAELKLRRQRIERLLEEGRYSRATPRAPGQSLTLAWNGRFDL